MVRKHAMGCVTMFVVASTVLLSASAHAAPAEHERLIEKAAIHAADAEYLQALEAYEAAHEALPEAERGSTLARFIVLDATQAALDDYDKRGDDASLRRARDLLQSFSAVAEVPLGQVPAKIAEVEELIAKHGPPPFMPEVPVLEEGDGVGSVGASRPLVNGSSASVREASGGERQRKRRAGLVLAVAGGAVTLAGVGVIAAGARQVPWMESKLEERGWMGGHPQHSAEYRGFVLEARRVQNVDYGVGTAMVVAGVVGVTVGVVMLVRGGRDGAVMWLRH